MRMVFLTLAVVALAACSQSPVEVAQQNCAAYGYTPNTPEYARCAQVEAAAVRQSRDQAGSDWLDYWGSRQREQSQTQCRWLYGTWTCTTQ